MFVVAAAVKIIPQDAEEFLANDPQQLLPHLILNHMPFIAQVFFFGALVSAIKSCSSATLLAPSTSFVENILRHIRPDLNDRQLLTAMRVTILAFTAIVLTYAILMRGTSIYEMVSAAYQVTLVGAFVPLTFGLYWRKATTQGATLSIFCGIGTWLILTFVESLGESFPGPLGGLLASILGMIVGSTIPQWVRDRKTSEADSYQVHPEHLRPESNA
jgi:Na+/proline symporter